MWGCTGARDQAKLPRRHDYAGVESRRMNRASLNTQGKDRYPRRATAESP